MRCLLLKVRFENSLNSNLRPLRERLDILSEDKATALLAERYSGFREKGHEWWRALKLAVELA